MASLSGLLVSAVPTILVRRRVVLVCVTLPLLPGSAAPAIAPRFRPRIGAVAGPIVALGRFVGHMALLLLAAIVVIA